MRQGEGIEVVEATVRAWLLACSCMAVAKHLSNDDPDPRLSPFADVVSELAASGRDGWDLLTEARNALSAMEDMTEWPGQWGHPYRGLRDASETLTRELKEGR